MKKIEHPSPEGALLYIYNRIVERIKTMRELKERDGERFNRLQSEALKQHDVSVEKTLEVTNLFATLRSLEELEDENLCLERELWHLIRMFDLRRNRAKLDGLHEYEPPKKNMVTEATA